jgi:hypothetical protein
MAKKSQKYGFNYISDENGINVLTGTKEESDEEKIITCYNGYAVFECNSKTYMMRYPKIQQLTNEMKDEIDEYCGYAPEAGEYGVIAMTFGKVVRSTESKQKENPNTNESHITLRLTDTERNSLIHAIQKRKDEVEYINNFEYEKLKGILEQIYKQ